MKTLSKDLLKTLKDSNCRVYQVGGSVRDSFLGRTSKDLDILVTGIDLEDLNSLLKNFGTTDLVGKSFGVIKFKPKNSSEVIDVSVPRIDLKSTGEHHRDFQIVLGKDISLEQDLARRDFTINAIARDLETGEIIDIGNQGRRDLRKKLIRVVSKDSFKDDPLRMLRAIQFASRFNFTIEEETLNMLKENVKLISTVSSDRFLEELKKMFYKSKKPSVGVKLLVTTGILEEIFKVKCDISEFNLRHLDRTNNNFDSFLYLLILMVSIGSTYKEFLRILGTLKVSNVDIKILKQVYDFFDGHYESESEEVIVYGIKDYLLESLEAIDDIFKAMKRSTRVIKLQDKFRAKGVPTSLKELSIKGDDLLELGIEPKEIGKTLDRLLKKALEIKTNSKEELLKEI